MLNQNADLKFNSKGYLADFDAWSKEFAVNMAKEHDIELTDCHWLIINFMRDYYSEFDIPPEPRIIIKSLSEQIDPHVPCTRKRLDGLFADGGCELACKIAGLPDCHCRPI